MVQYNLGKVVGNDGAKGDTGDKGDKGDTGVGITNITKTSTSGLVDTYTVYLSNGNTSSFTVTNGDDATVTIVTSWSGTLSDTKVASEKLVKNSLDAKVTGSVANNLTTTTSGYVLDARQGKALADLIGDAITYINM